MRKTGRMIFSTCLTLPLLLTARSSHAVNAISVNVGARGSNIGALTAADIAGAFPVANWNDLSVGTGFDATVPSAAAGSLKDSTGATVPSMAFAFGGTFALQIGYNFGPDGVHDANLKLMSGFVRGSFDADKGISLNVTSIPYPTYDLYVYADTFGSLITQYTVNGNTFYGLDSSPSNFAVSNYVFSQFTTTSLAAAQAEFAAPSSTHNYVKFTGLTGPNLALTAFQANGGAGGEEGIQGFQIVQSVPEPGSLALACLGIATLAAFRRNRSQSAVY